MALPHVSWESLRCALRFFDCRGKTVILVALALKTFHDQYCPPLFSLFCLLPRGWCLAILRFVVYVFVGSLDVVLEPLYFPTFLSMPFELLVLVFPTCFSILSINERLPYLPVRF